MDDRVGFRSGLCKFQLCVKLKRLLLTGSLTFFNLFYLSISIDDTGQQSVGYMLSALNFLDCSLSTDLLSFLKYS